MGTRSLAVVIAFGFVASAHADPKGDIQAKSKEAMESYDLMDYDAAKKLLGQALQTAKKAKADKDPLTAKVYLDLGIVAFAASEQDAAKTAFKAACQIDPKIQIDPAYKSPELVKLLDEARGGGGGAAVEPSEPVDSSVDCKGAKGLQHEILDSAKRNTPQPIEAIIGSDVKPAKVAVMFRVAGATEFTEVKLTGSGCKYTGAIPASAMHGELVHYYVAAYDGNNKVIASKGAAGSPNIIELTGSATAALPKAGGDDEDPLHAKKTPKKVVATHTDDGGGEIHKDPGEAAGPRKDPRILIAVAGGTGFGYVTGKTEGNNEVQNCCIGNSLVVITPELGFYVNRKLSISLAARIGLPLGANVMDHATAAPAGLLRLRYAFAESGEGLRVLGQAGFGVLRNTIKLDNAEMGMDTDIVAQGPLLLGAGLGYTKKLGGSVSFIVDLSAIAGIAITSKLGTAVLNTGVSADLSLGLAFGF
jgi:hypothetical protein